MTLIILDPTDERVPVERQISRRNGSISGTIGLLDISKPRGNVLRATPCPRQHSNHSFRGRRNKRQAIAESLIKHEFSIVIRARNLDAPRADRTIRGSCAKAFIDFGVEVFRTAARSPLRIVGPVHPAGTKVQFGADLLFEALPLAPDKSLEPGPDFPLAVCPEHRGYNFEIPCE